MKVSFDRQKKRLLAGGLDNILKYFSFNEDITQGLKVEYKLKVPSEIFSLSFSHCGNHYALGLNDSTLIIKSKLLEEAKEEDEE